MGSAPGQPSTCRFHEKCLPTAQNRPRHVTDRPDNAARPDKAQAKTRPMQQELAKVRNNSEIPAGIFPHSRTPSNLFGTRIACPDWRLDIEGATWRHIAEVCLTFRTRVLCRTKLAHHGHLALRRSSTFAGTTCHTWRLDRLPDNLIARPDLAQRIPPASLKRTHRTGVSPVGLNHPSRPKSTRGKRRADPLPHVVP